ncbi:hypothetical protein SLITO_v1c08710 [Spiroplasma litorale]|uniref:Uncharacterized protein n=1 Tax=Spiroplasma litorale TaxID=216942 RepID=A0A0K1W2T1_9MOLU|nr:hypothetical protein [Spiroplasma litorale]AKX34486.1 hypothetical protein SLITO_v1c08710 [Spiroplasma litorale]
MTKLNIDQKREVVGGAGLSGAFLDGIANIIKSLSTAINDTIGSISTSILAGKVINNVDKFDMKIGSNSLSFDRTKSNESKAQPPKTSWGSIF